VALNVRNQSGDIVGTVRAELECLTSAHRARRGKFPPTEPDNGAPLDGGDLGSKTLVGI
jgi:hypothetical protein